MDVMIFPFGIVSLHVTYAIATCPTHSGHDPGEMMLLLLLLSEKGKGQTKTTWDEALNGFVCSSFGVEKKEKNWNTVPNFFRSRFTASGNTFVTMFAYLLSFLSSLVTDDDALSVCAEEALYPIHMPCHPSEYRLRHITYLKAQHVEFCIIHRKKSGQLSDKNDADDNNNPCHLAYPTSNDVGGGTRHLLRKFFYLIDTYMIFFDLQ